MDNSFSRFSDYKFSDHTSDLSVIVYSSDIEGVFEASIKAIVEFLQLDLNKENDAIKTDSFQLATMSDSLEYSLMSTLNEILFYIQYRQFVPASIDFFKVDKSNISFSIRGKTYPPEKFEIFTEIKSVTFYNLDIKEYDDDLYAYKASWIADL